MTDGKDIKFSTDARSRLLKGVNLLTKILSCNGLNFIQII